VAKFSWENSVRRILDVYNQTCNAQSPAGNQPAAD